MNTTETRGSQTFEDEIDLAFIRHSVEHQTKSYKELRADIDSKAFWLTVIVATNVVLTAVLSTIAAVLAVR